MKKVFIVHGFEGKPNGGWRPWLMGELEKLDIYACALAMPNPYFPKCGEWISEISRHIKEADENIFLIGHSLGVPAILRYLETTSFSKKFGGVFLVSGPCEKEENPDDEEDWGRGAKAALSELREKFHASISNMEFVTIFKDIKYSLYPF